MSSVEPARHALYSRLEEVLGSEHAETLMTHLPLHQTDEVATKGDIARLEVRFDDEFGRLEDRFDRFEERIEGRFAALDERLDQMHRIIVWSIVGSMTAVTAIFSLMVSLLD